jgi:hypothetical protein
LPRLYAGDPGAATGDFMYIRPDGQVLAISANPSRTGSVHVQPHRFFGLESEPQILLRAGSSVLPAVPAPLAAVPPAEAFGAPPAESDPVLSPDGRSPTHQAGEA